MTRCARLRGPAARHILKGLERPWELVERQVARLGSGEVYLVSRTSRQRTDMTRVREGHFKLSSVIATSQFGGRFVITSLVIVCSVVSCCGVICQLSFAAEKVKPNCFRYFQVSCITLRSLENLLS